MTEMKLIRLIKAFSENEWKEFEKFAASPYFNKGRNYIPFIKELKKFYPDFVSGKFTKQYIYGKLFPGKSFKESVINTMASGLHSVAEDFLVHNDLKNDLSRKNMILTREISLKGLKKETDLLINKVLTGYERKKLGFYDYHEKYLFYEEIYDHYFINDERSKLYPAISRSNLFLARYFIHMLIQAENQFLSTVNFSKVNYRKSSLGSILKLTEFEKIIAILENDSYNDTVVIKIYYYLLLANKYHENDSYYYKAKELITVNYESLDTDLKNRCYVNLLGICSAKTIEGNLKWNRESFELYKVILKEKLYYFTGEKLKLMPRRIFRNVITIGINNDETEWTKNFIKDYIGEVEPRYRDTLFNYGMAKVEFNNKNYDKALYHINSVTQDQLIYKIEMKNIQSKIYYETNSVEPLFSLLDTYRHLINNSGIINKALIKRHENFIKFLKLFFKLKIGNKVNFNYSAVIKNLEKQKYINSKSWLQKKINELKQ